MKYSKRVILLLIGIIMTVLLLSCDISKPGRKKTAEESRQKGNSTSFLEGARVVGLQCSRLNYKDRIELRWDHLKGADSYIVYRYKSKGDVSPQKLNANNNRYIDRGASNKGLQNSIPYYYRVSAVKGSMESKKSGFVMGIRGELVDKYESSNSYLNNDEQSRIEGQKLGTLFNSTEKPLIYYIPDGALKANLDSDWYKYVGPPGGFNINIKLKRGTGFKTGDLKFRVSYKGKRSDPENILIGPAESSHSFSKFEGNPDNVVIYYQIYVDETVLSRTNPIIEEYTVRVGL